MKCESFADNLYEISKRPLNPPTYFYIIQYMVPAQFETKNQDNDNNNEDNNKKDNKDSKENYNKDKKHNKDKDNEDKDNVDNDNEDNVKNGVYHVRRTWIRSDMFSE